MTLKRAPLCPVFGKLLFPKEIKDSLLLLFLVHKDIAGVVVKLLSQPERF